MEGAQTYLQDAVVGDEKIVTYRLLSREVKVHVQLAKEMLFAFWAAQNRKNPGSVSATYLLTGERRAVKTEDAEGDVAMEDASQPAESEAPVRSVVIVSQEKLEATKATFTRLSSIHIYSVSPAPLTSVGPLSGVCHDLLSTFNPTAAIPEPLATYGTITNPAAKRRGKPLVVPTEPAVKKEHVRRTSTVQVPAQESAKKSVAGNVKKVVTSESQESAKAESVKSTPDSTPASTAPKPAKQKSTQQSFFASWGSAAQKQKEKPKPATAKPSTPAVKAEPTETRLSSSPEPSRSPTPEPVHPEPHAADRKLKTEELEAMMNMSSPEPSPPPESIPEPKQEPKQEPKKRAAEVLAAAPARRRGKRKVMKEVHAKDEEGYLVTTQEATWESYSEDEKVKPEPVKVEKKAPAGKKVAPAKGQGNLMNFFGKK